MINNCGIKPSEILAVTFTNKAAGEMKERIAALVGEAAHQVWAGTFHSMCARILRVDGQAIGIPPQYSIFDEADQQAIVKEILARLEPVAATGERGVSWKPSDILAAISAAKNELVDPATYRRTRRGNFEKLVAKVYERYQRALEQNQALDFDDLIMKAVELLQTQPAVLQKYQQRFRYILVDEYQDINYAQFRFVELLAQGHRNLCVVGDDDQSIYGWRGAKVGIILDFQKHFPDATVIKLEQNYRSTGKIIECAFEVIRRNKGRADKRLWTANPPGDNLVVYQAINGEEEAEWVAQTIASQVRTGSAQPGDYAVLYRTNAMSRAFEQALAVMQIPYQIIGGLKFFERAEIKDAVAYLRVLFNPADDLSLRRIINTPPRGIGEGTVRELTVISERDGVPLLRAARLFAADEDRRLRARVAVSDFCNLISGLRDRVPHMSLAELVRAVIEDTGMREYYRSTGKAEDAMRVENLEEFVSTAAVFASKQPGAGLAEFLEHIALISDIDEAEDLRGAVSLMTLHSAKGLEFPVVFMVGMEEGVFPHERSMGDEFELEEERRLAYVGMTRAQKMLYLSHAFQRTIFGEVRRQQPSRFLRDLPQNLLDHHGRLPSSSQPHILSLDDAVLEPARSGRSLDIASLMSRARANAARARTAREVAEEKSASPRRAASSRRQQKQSDDAWKAGDRVRHPKYGPGVVVTAEADGDDWKVTVAFKNAGVKKLLAGVARLERD